MRRRLAAAVSVVLGASVGVFVLPVLASADVGSLPAGTGEARSATFASFSVSNDVRMRVDVGSGNLLVQTAELSMPGISANVTLGAVYNSLLVGSSAPAGSMGGGWRDRSGADTRLSVNSDGSVTYVAPDGDTGVFQPKSGGGYTTPSEFRGGLTKNSDGSWTLAEHAGDTLSFSSAGRLTKISDRNGQDTTFAYSGAQQTTITSSRGPASAHTVTVSYTGSAISGYSQTADGTARTATFHQDSSGNLTSIADPAHHTTTIGYNAAGLVSSLTVNGAETDVAYDSSNRVTAITQYATTDPTHTSVTRLSYPSSTQTLLADANTDQSQTVSAVPHTTYTTDASSKRVTKAVDPAGNSRSTSYTSLGDVQTSSDAYSNTTTNTWGANGGESLISSATATGSSQAWAYDNTATSTNPTAAYQPSSSTDAQGNTSAYTYDGPGNLSANSNAMAATAKVDHNSDGTVKSSTDPKNGTNSTTYGYDTDHQLRTITPVSGSSLGQRSATYDGFGRLKTLTDGAGHTTTYQYYDDDQVKTVSYSDGTPTVSYVYDDAGNMTSRTDRTGLTTWTYDYRNQMLTRASASGGGTLTYTYDKVGNLHTVQDASGTTTDEYNTRNLLIRQTDAAGHLYRFFYDNNGRRTNTYFNTDTNTTTWAAKTSIDYDNDGRILRIKTYRDSTTSTLVSDISYCYAKHVSGQACSTATADDTGLRQWQTDNLSGAVSVFSYDTANRLTGVTNYHGHTYGYGYDANGNRTSVTVDGTSTQSPTFNAANQTTTSGDTYDGAGNQTHDALGTLGYNAAAQMTSGPNGYYTYADTTQKELVTGPAGSYVWGHPDNTGNPWLQSATISGQQVYLDHDNNGTPLGIQIGTTDYTYITDGQGSILGLITADGTLAATYTYDPYGTPTATTGTTATTNPLGYTGGLRDTTGLLKLGRRWYDPSTGRFAQQDSLNAVGDPSRGNRYAYAGDNPINYVDPAGTDYLEGGICDGEGAAGCVNVEYEPSTGTVGVTPAIGLGLGADAEITENGGSLNSGWGLSGGGCAGVLDGFGPCAQKQAGGGIIDGWGIGAGAGAGIFADLGYTYTF